MILLLSSGQLALTAETSAGQEEGPQSGEMSPGDASAGGLVYFASLPQERGGRRPPRHERARRKARPPLGGASAGSSYLNLKP